MLDVQIPPMFHHSTVQVVYIDKEVVSLLTPYHDNYYHALVEGSSRLLLSHRHIYQVDRGQYPTPLLRNKVIFRHIAVVDVLEVI
jgi:hypothetical protein